jgi:hypothetical protein
MVQLFPIFARDEETAVIIRRGPSRWHHLVQWDTRRDRFLHGAWFKGRIYEEKCDLSPDGKLLVYFVLKGSHSQTKFTHAWTAVSRVPYLKALILWPQGTTYGGGGRFFENRSLALRGVTDPPLDEFPLAGLQIVKGPTPVHESIKEVPEADWCGRDHRNHLVFTVGGQLFRRQKTEDTMIADFTALRPDPMPAPEWAGRPL